MAEPLATTELGRWRGEQVRLGEVVEALADLRRGEQRTATRASVTTLVLVAGDGEEVDSACDAVHRLGRRHPGRNIVVRPRAEAAPDGIDAEVMLHAADAEGHPVWSEDVRLDVRGAAAAHLESLVEPLTLPDLPVAVWFLGSVPTPDDPLLRVADAVVVDSACLGPGALSGLADLARRRVVLDLCWERLRPWRQLVASQFEAPATRPFVAGVREVAVEGPPSAAHLLAGWLAARLGLPAEAVTVTDGPGLSVRLTAAAAGATATVSVTEGTGPSGTSLRASTTVDGASRREERVAQPDDPLAWSLGEALTRMARDRVYGQALQAALVFGG